MKLKTCSKCGETKPIKEFYKNTKGKYGVRSICKLCEKEYYKFKLDEKRKYKKLYNKSYPWKRILNNINYRINSNDPKIFPYYKNKNITNYLTEEDIKYLWNRDKAYEMKKPEIDRINSDKDYTLENCQFIEMNSHRNKDNSKVILQFDLNGNFIREWQSIKEASNHVNGDCSNICKCL